MEAADSALMVARAQFAITIGFHIVLAALTIGLANFLMVLEGLWLWRGCKIHLDIYRYWLKVFALNVVVERCVLPANDGDGSNNAPGLKHATGSAARRAH
ncbi:MULTISPECIES: cytochrome ubiquinol oxidase subunit I [Pseudomonas]|uniref:Uncharacterized protein n=1 Tax=Pseudomonas izuensis TaxID=2684212 RepID=A0ABM7RYH7_9PSED|nr:MULTISPECIES: cytochrome ubiquinol oxidase subunit I [Pseudomonas]RKS24956.1 bd-type cytochrome oxidase subunit I [Pseudomonas sp. WPR_5_2]BCX67568.1 hypothetical protein LAB08_R22030 [Pseudomonas izuensis]